LSRATAIFDYLQALAHFQIAIMPLAVPRYFQAEGWRIGKVRLRLQGQPEYKSTFPSVLEVKRDNQGHQLQPAILVRTTEVAIRIRTNGSNQGRYLSMPP
jgi:hypothetical protein